ncbi:hypothetical protein TNCV_4772571 [Trichonephila clavipes]|nr:hypothetical protein TNCV_4772571 [Trichonephila clavipes]
MQKTLVVTLPELRQLTTNEFPQTTSTICASVWRRSFRTYATPTQHIFHVPLSRRSSNANDRFSALFKTPMSLVNLGFRHVTRLDSPYTLLNISKVYIGVLPNR